MAAGQCPTDFFQSGSGCFGIVDQPGVNMTWDECRTSCQAYSSAEWAVDLASFDDCADMETFSQTWQDVGKWFCWRFGFGLCVCSWTSIIYTTVFESFLCFQLFITDHNAIDFIGSFPSTTTKPLQHRWSIPSSPLHVDRCTQSGWRLADGGGAAHIPPEPHVGGRSPTRHGCGYLPQQLRDLPGHLHPREIVLALLYGDIRTP